MARMIIPSTPTPDTINDVIDKFSGENLMRLQKHFVSFYGSDEMAREKATSFAVGFGKACDLIVNDLKRMNL